MDAIVLTVTEIALMKKEAFVEFFLRIPNSIVTTFSKPVYFSLRITKLQKIATFYKLLIGFVTPYNL